MSCRCLVLLHEIMAQFVVFTLFLLYLHYLGQHSDYVHRHWLVLQKQRTCIELHCCPHFVIVIFVVS